MSEKPTGSTVLYLAACPSVAVVAWALLPKVAEQPPVVVIPAALAASCLSLWCHSRAGHRLWGGVPAAAVWLMATLGAVFVPSPESFWSAGSLVMWGLIGDPGSPWIALASVLGGGTLLILYASAMTAVARLVLGSLPRWRAKVP